MNLEKITKETKKPFWSYLPVGRQIHHYKTSKKPFWSYLPIGSGIYYYKNSKKKTAWGYIKHISYPLLLTPVKYIIPWVIAGFVSGEWNPNNQLTNIKENIKSKKEILKQDTTLDSHTYYFTDTIMHTDSI